MISHHWLVSILWICWGSYWGWAAARGRAPERAEATRSRLIHLVSLAAAFLLLFLPPLSIGPLGWRLVPDTPGFLLGSALTLLGLAFATWAQVHLGPNWSGIIGTRDRHRLIRTGPYALVRHPMYSGILVAIVGTAISIGELRALLGAALAIVAYIRKIRIEEPWLLARFGSAYTDYRRDVSALVPLPRRFRRSSSPERRPTRHCR
jgi:protein-S-isoprenylcysteine O-methyltransferase Ste14